MSTLSHLVHIILCLLTGFLWIPIYFLCAISANKAKHRRMMERKNEELELLRIIAGRKDRY